MNAAAEWPVSTHPPSNPLRRLHRAYGPASVDPRDECIQWGVTVGSVPAAVPTTRNGGSTESSEHRYQKPAADKCSESKHGTTTAR